MNKTIFLALIFLGLFNGSLYSMDGDEDRDALTNRILQYAQIYRECQDPDTYVWLRKSELIDRNFELLEQAASGILPLASLCDLMKTMPFEEHENCSRKWMSKLVKALFFSFEVMHKRDKVMWVFNSQPIAQWLSKRECSRIVAEIAEYGMEGAMLRHASGFDLPDASSCDDS